MIRHFENAEKDVSHQKRGISALKNCKNMIAFYNFKPETKHLRELLAQKY